MSILEEFTHEIEQEIQSMNTVDELLEHLVKSETIKWNRMRDYLIMKAYGRYVEEGTHRNTHAFVMDMSNRFECSPETVKNIIYGKAIRKVVKTEGR